MPRKPPSEWSPAYAARQARAAARGLTGPAARGHKPREHVTRAINKGLVAPLSRAQRAARKQATDANRREERRVARQQAAGAKRKAPSPVGLTRAQKDYVRRQGKRLAARSIDPGDDEAFTQAGRDAIEYAQRVGIEKFKAQIDLQYEAMLDGDKSRGWDQLMSWQADDGFPDIRWYFYH